MIGLVLVTHGRLASEFVVAMEHVVGPQERIAAICIGPDDDMDQRRKDIAKAIAKVDDGGGVIILTDLFGGTPSNLAISLMKSDKIEVIAGRQPADADPARGRAQDDGRPRRGRRGARGRAQIYLGRLRNPGRGGGLTAVSRTVEVRNKRGLHARASAKFVTLAAQIDAAIEVEKDGTKVCGTSIMGLMMLGAAMGDTITISATGLGAEQAVEQLVGAGRGALPRGVTARAPADHRFLQSAWSSRRAGSATRRTGAPRGCFLAEGLRILTEAREAGVLPELLFFSDASHPLVAALIAETEAAGGEAIETMPDILHKISGKDNPQTVLGVYRGVRHRPRTRSTAPPRRSGSSPRRCATRAISAPSCAPATRSARAG